MRTWLVPASLLFALLPVWCVKLPSIKDDTTSTTLEEQRLANNISSKDPVQQGLPNISFCYDL